jgi:hypothetical protein
MSRRTSSGGSVSTFRPSERARSASIGEVVGPAAIAQARRQLLDAGLVEMPAQQHAHEFAHLRLRLACHVGQDQVSRLLRRAVTRMRESLLA